MNCKGKGLLQLALTVQALRVMISTSRSLMSHEEKAARI